MALAREEGRQEQRGAVDHRGVDHLALARRAPRVEQRRRTSPRARSMPPPPKSATRLSGGVGGCPARPMWASGAGERDVVDVVARPRRPAARPGPSRSCGRRRGAGCGRGSSSGPMPEPLGHAGPEALEERVGAARRGDGTTSAPSAALRSTRDRAAAAAEHVVAAPSRVGAHRAVGAGRRTTTSAPRSASTMAQNGPGPMPGQLDDLHARQRSHGPGATRPRRLRTPAEAQQWPHDRRSGVA